MRDRQAFGKPLADLQIVQEKLGRMHADYLAARGAAAGRCHQLCRRRWRRPHLISAAKMFATDAAMRNTVEAVQLHGGTASICTIRCND